MIKKIAPLALILASAAQADSSCDVTSRLYGGVGLGFSTGYAPVLKDKLLSNAVDKTYNALPALARQALDASKIDITTSYKKMRALATRLALGGQLVIPGTCLVLGGEVSFGIGGPKGRIKQNLEEVNLSRVPPVTFYPSGFYSVSLQDRWNMAFTGTIGLKVGRFLPYTKLGVSIHSFKMLVQGASSVRSNIGVARSETFESAPQRKKRALFVMGFGVEYNLTKNVIIGGEWTHHRGTLGLFNKEERANPTREVKKLDKIRINEFMLTCKYAFPVTR